MANLSRPWHAGSQYDAAVGHSLAAPDRNWHAGAVTTPNVTPVAPASGPQLDTVLSALAKAITQREDPNQVDKGKVSSVGRLEERLVFIARAADNFRISLAPGVTGRDAFHALRAAATNSRPLLRQLKVPINLTNRVIYSLVAVQHGGRCAKSGADYAACAGDYPATTEEDFDAFRLPSGYQLEKKPRMPTTLVSWHRCALRQAYVASLFYGAEYLPEFEGAAHELLRLGEELSFAWPMTMVMDVWEELWMRWCSELRDIDVQALAAMHLEHPSFEQLRFFLTSPGADGAPWLRIPRCFDLQDVAEYFQTDIIPRQQRLLTRTCWQAALRSQAKRDRSSSRSRRPGCWEQHSYYTPSQS